MYTIDYHADDYGISPNNSKRMLELMSMGKLDSFSIIPNMSGYEESMAMLRASWASLKKKPLISVHLNLIDGFRLSSTKKEIIHGSFGKLFMHWLFPSPGREKLKRQLTAEIKCQIEKVYNDTRCLSDDTGSPVALRIDSHVHTHMIPMVFDSLTEALKESGLIDKVQYIRTSDEPLMMFLTTGKIAGTCPPVNAVKNILLSLLSVRMRRELKKYNIPTGMLWGLMMSGKMDHDRVTVLLPKMKKYAQKRNAHLEILCHPGIVLPSEISSEHGPDDLTAFPSPNRNIEYDMIAKRE